jgi:hypothetical protein
VPKQCAMKTYRRIRGNHVFSVFAVSLSASPLWQLCRLRKRDWYSNGWTPWSLFIFQGAYWFAIYVWLPNYRMFLIVLQNCVGSKKKSLKPTYSQRGTKAKHSGKCKRLKVSGGQIYYTSKMSVRVRF